MTTSSEARNTSEFLDLVSGFMLLIAPFAIAFGVAGRLHPYLAVAPVAVGLVCKGLAVLNSSMADALSNQEAARASQEMMRAFEPDPPPEPAAKPPDDAARAEARAKIWTPPGS